MLRGLFLFCIQVETVFNFILILGDNSNLTVIPAYQNSNKK